MPAQPQEQPAASSGGIGATLAPFNLGALNIGVTGHRKLGKAHRFALAGALGAAGSIAVREVFPGIRLLLVDVRNLPQDAVVALDAAWTAWGLVHCQNGDLSGHVEGVPAVELASGEVALLAGQGRPIALHVHGGRMRGMALVVDDATLTRDVRTVMRSFFDIDAPAMRQRLSGGASMLTLPESLELTHVFNELYTSFVHAEPTYLRLKAFELLSHGARLNLASLPEGGTIPSPSASTSRHAAIALRAQEAMMRDLSCTLTVAQLATKCATSSTVLKESFREVFGMPVYSWLRMARMQRACELMEENPARSVADVAAEVGYANPSKFAKAFSDTMGTTPSAYRASLN